ncbi:MAG: T9SS type A sorting domain-containing protein [Flavobacteriales bacterium]|nr:T9SS type A sorting domain-containing protein [Flavobacteriales bacterium]
MNNALFIILICISSSCYGQITTISSTSTLCNGNCTGTATVSTTGSTPYTYLWSNSLTAQSIAGLCTGQYFITATDNLGLQFIDSTYVSEPSQLGVTIIASDSVACCGEEITLMAAPSGGTPAYSVIWSDTLFGIGSNTISLCSQTEIFSATITDANGCTSYDDIVINAGPSLLVDMPDTVGVCIGNPLLISSTGFGGIAISDYQWTWSSNPGDTCNSTITCDIIVTPTTNTSYLVTLSDGCSTPATGSIMIVVSFVPTASFGVLENEGCLPFEAYFNGSSSSASSGFLWDFNGDGIIDYTDENSFSTPSFTYQESGQYSVGLTLVSEDQCSTSVYIQDYINIFDYSSIDAEIITIDGLAHIFDVQFFHTSGVGVDMWSFSNGNISSNSQPIQSFSGNGLHWGTLTNTDGCETTIWIEATEELGPQFINGIKETTTQPNVIKSYPNPSTGAISFRIIGIENVKIYTVLGALIEIREVNDRQIDLSQLGNGTYFLQVNSKEKTYFSSVQILR